MRLQTILSIYIPKRCNIHISIDTFGHSETAITMYFKYIAPNNIDTKLPKINPPPAFHNLDLIFFFSLSLSLSLLSLFETIG